MKYIVAIFGAIAFLFGTSAWVVLNRYTILKDSGYTIVFDRLTGSYSTATNDNGFSSVVEIDLQRGTMTLKPLPKRYSGTWDLADGPRSQDGEIPEFEDLVSESDYAKGIKEGKYRRFKDEAEQGAAANP